MMGVEEFDSESVVYKRSKLRLKPDRVVTE